MQIVHFNAEQLQWMPVLAATKIYTGALVTVATAAPLEGVKPMPTATGINNTDLEIPLGVVVGNNNVSGSDVADSGGQYITQVAAGATYGSTAQYQPVEGEDPIGDRLAKVLVHRISPHTVIRAPIWDTTLGTDLAAVACTVASGGDGIGCTTAATTVATVPNFSTIYVRTGANRGVYRTLTSTSTTAHTWLHAMPADVAVGDSCVVINGLRPYGICKMQTDATGVFVDANAALTSHNFWIDVRRLDLSTAEAQYVEFTFTADNFCTQRT